MKRSFVLFIISILSIYFMFGCGCSNIDKGKNQSETTQIQTTKPKAKIVETKKEYLPKTVSYSDSPHNLLLFKKKGNILYVKTKEFFEKDEKPCEENAIFFKIDKKCKWRYRFKGLINPENKRVEKSSYREIKNIIDNDMQINDNGHHYIVIRVRDNIIISVTYESNY